ncbi:MULTISPECIES: DUF1540 domain-containing protein [Shouchella]|uniref:DUF1540 domain-containing protein n=3 Tax=Bacillaceae TaxID=186817 RepID=A0A060LS79_9BACI|nr:MULTISPECIES: DUF1540 domain-containing protein [Bacillaceae]RQW20008.1 DUF1540 domain-containing protein [Bacillus sp. C1-1]AIC94091.1 hypothetical protein BleG1_1508 [Shouchella lehensis G1]KQL57981.1 hypothetical protein AN965_06615 [Alkalicoccobacillus plakortidis]MBG9785722.1 hypothetical protein [Shouchella lehensis]TES48185.1 DUF1540 domain-containing protein [Shouchella lehensis]
MTPIVMCNVSNCRHWKEENRCGAEEILVQTDKLESTFSMEASKEFVLDQLGKVRKSEETCCHTFEPK